MIAFSTENYIQNIFSRLSLKKGGIILNEALIGKKLDDNSWHLVKILRIKRLLDISLDGHSEKTILIPGFSTKMFMNRVLYVGGKQKLSGQEKEHQIGNFHGCLGSVIVDNKHPLDELKKRSRNVVSTGVTASPCHNDAFKPIHFANPQAMLILKVPTSVTTREMKIRLQFRTFDSEGTLVFAEGSRCHFIIGVLEKKVKSISYYCTLSQCK